MFDQVELGAGVRTAPRRTITRVPSGVGSERGHGEQAGELGDRGLVDRPGLAVGSRRAR